MAAIRIFNEHLAHSTGLVKNISDDPWALDKLIVKPNAVNGERSGDDIHLFLLLRNVVVASHSVFSASLCTVPDASYALVLTLSESR